ncbi:hypothetical protein CLU92_4195 [Janthinobacterium sp. 61]|uniref:hypothetical protein n=1 Tax=Janthinobacterium sp. 61 TaxID=2035209 RepID=UPI000C708307|nr:hypothetical protein [Janthinobacterium sp. 61]PKV46765.1 hypothetical protein CLU92_4195 [Janthinobacterium sp. 61]
MSAGTLTYRTEIDWVELEVRTTAPSNFWSVQEVLRPVLPRSQAKQQFVTPLDGGNGGAATIFRFSIQDPERASKIEKVVAALCGRFDLVSIVVTGVEVAFDTYSQCGSIRQLAELAADRFRFITAKPSSCWHFYRQRGENPQFINVLPGRSDLVEHFEGFWQLADRKDKDTADVRYHAYVKTLDNGTELLPDRHRARFEITLRGAALPFQTVEELKKFNFAELAHYFKFRRIADNVPPAVKYALTSWSGRQLGLRGPYRRPDLTRVGKYNGTSIFRGSTVADDKLNADVYECLRQLTRTWRKRSRRADFPEVFLPPARMDT